MTRALSSSPRSTATGPWRRLLGALAVGALALTGCAGPAASGPEVTPADPAQAAPVTLTHQFGTTTVPPNPTRIVAVGYNDADFVLALGEVPVGVRDFIGDFDEDTRSWATGPLGGATPQKVGGTNIDFEAVAALQPDLILGVYSFLEQADYDTLSAIAPTIAQPGETTATWQEQTLITGRALGRTAQAQQLVADVERQFADAAAAHPEFAGKSVAVGLSSGADDGVYALEGTDLRARFFTDLGFVNTPDVGDISPENYGLLDKDVLVVLGGDASTFAGGGVFQNMAVVTERRTFYAGGFGTEFSGALGFGSPLSLPRALEIAIPELAAVTDGDATT